MNGRMYSVVFEEVAATVAQDLFEIIPAADSSVVVHALFIGQSSDAADAEAEQVSIIVHRGVATGSGGTGPTPVPLSLGDAAFGGTAEVNNTTQSVEGVILHADAFNIQAGYQIILPPEMRWVVSPSDVFIIELQTAPSDSVTFSGTVYFEEIGG